MQDDFSLESYDYILPESNIAQHPCAERDRSKLLVLDRRTGAKEHRLFSHIPEYFQAGDILVVNDTKVFPARLLGSKETGGKAEVFLLEYPRECATGSSAPQRVARAAALIKSSKRPAPGTRIHISDTLSCVVLERFANGDVMIELVYPAGEELSDTLLRHGSVPLPPYISRPSGTSDEDRRRYQTVYAAVTGAVAAPTAGLHFTDPVIDVLKKKGVDIASLTLHVGYGTFAPVRSESIREHSIHKEYVSIPTDTAARIRAVKERGGKVWAVGTTTVRALEFACDAQGSLQEVSGWCDLYIMPGYRFKVIDNLITNFHLPKSSLLFLVAALCGRETLLSCYQEAIARGYRFYSYGDAMAIIG